MSAALRGFTILSSEEMQREAEVSRKRKREEKEQRRQEKRVRFSQAEIAKIDSCRTELHKYIAVGVSRLYDGSLGLLSPTAILI